MSRILVIGAALLVAACATVHSNLPDKPTSQIRRDYHCNEMSGALVARAPTFETYDVLACGRPLRMSCPLGPHSRWRRCRYEEQGSADAAVLATVAAPTTTPPPQDADSNVRAQVDQHRDAILGCTGGALAVFDIAWDANASTASVSLVSAPGTPAEGCARAALGELVLPTGTRGAIRHVVAP